MISEGQTAARGQRRGFYWQDWYAALTMLRCVAEPAEGIRAVEVEAAGAPHVDDIVVHRDGVITYQQLKHKVGDNPRFTGADLFSVPNDGVSLLGKLYRGWDTVRKNAGASVEVCLVTNTVASSDRRNLLISPEDFEGRIVVPAREKTWCPPRDLQDTVQEIQTLAGAPDLKTLREFLRCLRFEYGAPDDETVRQEVVRLLGRQLRSSTAVAIESAAWATHVYDLSTRHDDTGSLSRDEIDRELRRLFGRNRVAEHRLALPKNHQPREAVAVQILDAVRAQREGYLLVAGPPGCGKTTLATWMANEHDDELLMRYHVFDPHKASRLERRERATALEFVTTMFDVLSSRFPAEVAPRLPAADRLPDAVGILRDELTRLAGGHTRFVIVDGIDHVVRAGVDRDSLLDALPHPAPAGVVFVLFGQPDWDYPDWLRRSPRVDVPGFTNLETRQYVCRRFGWERDDATAAAIADALHARSGGNPLSLFYNVALAETLGSTPNEVAPALAEAPLFGASPHSEYDRLLQDLESQLPTPQDSRSLRNELLACIAVATTAVTEERLCNAFSDDGLTGRQARDYLAGLGPVIVERNNGQFWLFHDDFRRYAEEQTSPAERQAAHRRFALALETDWNGDELSSLAEHCWLGGEYDRLAALPAKRTLDEWFEMAPSRGVVDLHRLALAAAFQIGDDVQIMRNALAAARASEAAELIEDSDSGLPPAQELVEWSFVAPPRDSGAEALRRRAQALTAAADGRQEDPALAAEIAGRFIAEPDVVSSGDPHDWHQVRAYTEALTRWLLRSGAASDAMALVPNDRLGGYAAAAVGSEFTAEMAPNLVGEWARALAGEDHALDRELVKGALEHLINGRERAAGAITRALLDCPRTGREARRDAGVLLSLIEQRIHTDATWVDAVVRWDSYEATDPMAWREFFFHGFVTTASGPRLELSSCGFPARFVNGVRRQNISDKRARLLRDGSWFWPRPHGRPGTLSSSVAS